MNINKIKKSIIALFIALTFAISNTNGAVVSDPVNANAETDTIKKELIKAKIFNRQGVYNKALMIYDGLKAVNPNNEEVWLGHIETLINLGDYELAFNNIEKLKRLSPNNLNVKRLEAQIYHKLGMHEKTFDIYENILADNRHDIGAWSDYAFSKLNTGNWADSLDYFMRILELDPENETAIKMSHEILKERRPNLKTKYNVYTQGLDDETVSFSAEYSRHLSVSTLLFVDYNHIVVDRAEEAGFDLTSIDETLDETVIRAQKEFNDKLAGQFGIGAYSGLNDGLSFIIGLGYKIGDNSMLEANYVNNKPWFDPLSAADEDGNFDKINISFNWSFFENWSLFVDLERMNYSIDEVNDYGDKRSFSGILSRKMVKRNGLIPDVYFSYSFYRSIFDYTKENERQVPLVKSSDRHAFTFNIENKITNKFSYTLAGSVNKDYARELEGWNVSPGLKVSLGKRYEITTQYNFASESSNFGGGDTETFTFGINSIF